MSDVLQISAFSCRLTPPKPTIGCKASNDLFDKEVLNINPEVIILAVRNNLEKLIGIFTFQN